MKPRFKRTLDRELAGDISHAAAGLLAPEIRLKLPFNGRRET